MGKVIIKPGDLRKNGPKGEHITRIMYDDNEPPKNYIWGKPDGFLYQWNGAKWVKLNETPHQPPYDFPLPPMGGYVTKSELDGRLKMIKNEIISYLTKLINMRNCSGGSGESAIEWVNENVIPDLRRLQEIDHDAFATKDELSTAISEAMSDVASSSAITSLDQRLDALEAIDHSVFVTASTIAPYDASTVTQYATQSQLDAVANALNLKANATDIPRNTSDLTNDSGYITTHQSLDNYYTKSEVNGLLAEKAKMVDITTDAYEALSEPQTDVIYNIIDESV